MELRLTTRTFLAAYDRRGFNADPARLHEWLACAPAFPGALASHWIAGPVGLAQRCWRASPASHAASAPTVDEAFSLCADVRLDEREALVEALGLEPAQLSTLSDEQLILLSHRQWSTDAPAHLRGAFAYAIYDRRRERLQVARDPMGEKPLLYYEDASRVLVSSVIAPILAHPAVPERIDPHGVACLLTSAAGELDWTLFEGIRQVEPGQSLLFSATNVARHRFWSFTTRPALRHQSLEDYASHFRGLLDASLRDRFRDRGRTALSLSGGLDSTSIAASLSALGLPSPDEPVQAISYVFDELTSCDERRFIEPVVERYGLPWSPIQGDNLWPLRDNPPFPVHPHHVQLDPYAHLTRAVRRRGAALGCRTLLVGNHADALFDGGRYWLADQLAELRLSRAAHVLRQADVRVSFRRGIWPYGLRPLIPHSVLRGARTWAGRPDGVDHPAFGAKLIGRLGPRARDLAAYGAPPPCPAHRAGRMRDLVLRSASGVTAASRREHEPLGIEQIDPFRDLRLLDFVLRVPADILAEPPWTKRVLRTSMANRLPAPQLRRPGKTSLMPLLRRGLIDREAGIACALSKLHVAIDAGFVQPAWLSAQEQHDPHWYSESWLGWRLLALELFLRNRDPTL